jgi:hypothetical protein
MTLMSDDPDKPHPKYQWHKRKNTTALLHTRGWLSLREFCYIADITYPTGLRWCKLDMIKYIQVGGIKRVYEEEIVRFLQSGTLEANPEKWKVLNDKREAYKRTLALRKAGTRGSYGPHR